MPNALGIHVAHEVESRHGLAGVEARLLEGREWRADEVERIGAQHVDADELVHVLVALRDERACLGPLNQPRPVRPAPVVHRSRFLCLRGLSLGLFSFCGRGRLRGGGRLDTLLPDARDQALLGHAELVVPQRRHGRVLVPGKAHRQAAVFLLLGELVVARADLRAHAAQAHGVIGAARHVVVGPDDVVRLVFGLLARELVLLVGEQLVAVPAADAGLVVAKEHEHHALVELGELAHEPLEVAVGRLYAGQVFVELRVVGAVVEVGGVIVGA